MVTIPEFLSTSPDKRALYAADPYFRDTWRELCRAVDPADLERVLSPLAGVIFKPDAVVARVIPLALEVLAGHGFLPVAARPFRFDRHTVRVLWFYQLNIATDDRIELMETMLAAGESLYVVFHADPAGDGSPATQRFTELKGPGPPERRLPHHLRARLGKAQNYVLSYVHGSDAQADLVRDLAVCFPASARSTLLRQMLAAQDRTSEVLSLVAALHERHEAEELSFETALSRLEGETAAASGRAGGRGAALFEISALCDRIRAGAERDWRSLLRLADTAGLPMRAWDRIVIATTLLVNDREGEACVLENPWRQALRAGAPR